MNMDPTNLSIQSVTDPAEIPALARICELAMQGDLFGKYHINFTGASFEQASIKAMTEALQTPGGYVFKAVLQSQEEDGSVKDQIIGASQWYVGYLDIPKVDPFAPKTLLERDETQSANVDMVKGDGQAEAKTTNAVVEVVSEMTEAMVFKETMRITGNAYVSAIRGKKHVCGLTQGPIMSGVSF